MKSKRKIEKIFIVSILVAVILSMIAPLLTHAAPSLEKPTLPEMNFERPKNMPDINVDLSVERDALFKDLESKGFGQYNLDLKNKEIDKSFANQGLANKLSDKELDKYLDDVKNKYLPQINESKEKASSLEYKDLDLSSKWNLKTKEEAEAKLKDIPNYDKLKADLGKYEDMKKELGNYDKLKKELGTFDENKKKLGDYEKKKKELEKSQKKLKAYKSSSGGGGYKGSGGGGYKNYSSSSEFGQIKKHIQDNTNKTFTPHPDSLPDGIIFNDKGFFEKKDKNGLTNSMKKDKEVMSEVEALDKAAWQQSNKNNIYGKDYPGTGKWGGSPYRK